MGAEIAKAFQVLTIPGICAVRARDIGHPANISLQKATWQGGHVDWEASGATSLDPMVLALRSCFTRLFPNNDSTGVPESGYFHPV